MEYENTYTDGMESTSDSFWEIGQYKRTVKRVDDGYKLSNDLISMVNERMEIEKSYSKGLNSWSKKWCDYLDKGSEYGSTASGWRSFLTEAEKLSEIHKNIRHNLQDSVLTSIKLWQKDNYHKGKLGGFKESKEVDEGFKKAQKQWSKLCDKVHTSKKAYHTAAKTLNSAVSTSHQSKSDTSLSVDQQKKFDDRVNKYMSEKEKCHNKYDHQLKELKLYKSRYIEDMTVQFDRCQVAEVARLKFMEETFLSIHQCLDTSNNPSISVIYADLHNTLQLMDGLKDTKWWSMSHGKDMAMTWPDFEEWSEDLHQISKAKHRGHVPGDQMAAYNSVGSYRRKQEGTSPVAGTKDHVSAVNSISSKDKRDVGLLAPHGLSQDRDQSVDHSAEELDHSNPFANDDSDDTGQDATLLTGNSEIVDSVVAGYSVLAIHDYQGLELDELSFKAGEVFVQTEEKDDQGWCRGVLNGVEGLFPDGYVQRTV